MKKISILIILLVTSLTCFCQFSAKLDANYGFKIFKFKQSPSQIQNIKKIIENIIPQKNVTTYKYIGPDIRFFNGIEISEIWLDFYKNRLYQIKVCFGTIKDEYTIEEYTIVQNALINNLINVNLLEKKKVSNHYGYVSEI